MRYDVMLIPQTTGMGCWAASIAMILGWKNQASFDPNLIASNSGGVSYVPSLTHGLDPNDRYILRQNGFLVEEPVCYTPPGVANLLNDYGPLWLAGLLPLPGATGLIPHVRVVTGFENDQVYINDPWPVNSGRRYNRSFQEIFVGQMESLGIREINEPCPVYVAHLAAGF